VGRLRLPDLRHLSPRDAEPPTPARAVAILLNRRDDPADRRHVVLRLTDAGATQLELFRELNVGQIRTLLARIDAADLGVIGQALDVLAAAAARQAAAPPASLATEGEPA